MRGFVRRRVWESNMTFKKKNTVVWSKTGNMCAKSGLERKRKSTIKDDVVWAERVGQDQTISRWAWSKIMYF